MPVSKLPKGLAEKWKALKGFTHKWDNPRLKEAAKNAFNKSPGKMRPSDVNEFLRVVKEIEKEGNLTKKDKRLAAKLVLAFKKWTYEGKIKERLA